MSQSSFPPSKASTPAERIRAAGVNPDSDVEQDLWTGSYSAKAMLGQAILAGLLSLVLLIVTAAVPVLRGSSWAWLGLLVILVTVWMFLGGLLLYRRLDRTYHLTTQRFKHRAGILTRTSDRIELIDIDDVRVRQGPIQALVGAGNVFIRSSDESHPQFVLLGIAQVKEIADLIDDARRTERRKRGLHVEAI